MCPSGKEVYSKDCESLDHQIVLGIHIVTVLYYV